MKRIIGLGGVLALGVSTVLLATPALAADTAVLHVPSDVDFSATQTGGRYEVVATGLHVWTERAKVAGYVPTGTPLSSVEEPSLEYTNGAGGVPGFQLVVDFDDDKTADGILVGEPVYHGDWWVPDSAAKFVRDGAPSHTGGSGSGNHGLLDDWRSAFPDAQVLAFGFSLGSGVKGDGVINAINFAGTRYTFAEDVVLTSKDDCKDGGWATSYPTTFENQGECVSSFAKSKSKK